MRISNLRQKSTEKGILVIKNITIMGTNIIIPNADFSANAVCKELDTTLVNGYVNSGSSTVVVIDDSAPAIPIRVRTGELFGKFRVKTKSGYLIRSITCYNESLAPYTSGGHTVTGAENVVTASQQLTEYTYTGSKYAAITFCKTDATQTLSPNDDIIDEMFYLPD